MFALSTLWKAPEINPINNKARTVPLLNVVCVHGRVFFFSWLGFFIAFWSWYAFPPLLKSVIAKDIGLSQSEVLTSNIIALLATLLVRLVAGPLCDRFGARWVFAGSLLVGAIPTFLAGTAYNFSELCALRFFVGILGSSFVPCQVWTTAFFDKNVVGTANSLTAGFGNAGGGVTYFVMPAVYNSLVSNGLSTSEAWRVAFVVPGILIVTVAIALLLFCPDTPTGKWSERGQIVQRASSNAQSKHVRIAASEPASSRANDEEKAHSGTVTPKDKPLDEKKGDREESTSDDNEPEVGEQYEIDAAQHEVIQKPTWKEATKIIFSPQTLVMGTCYACTFGAELSVNSILGTYYGENIPTLSLQGSGNWAAMFGLMNVICRPLGGLVSDFAYRKTGTVWAKKILLHCYVFITGAFLVAVGLTDPKELGMLVGLINVGFAFFDEGANGLNFALVPHIHPFANGIVSGLTGAAGNFGGIIFSIVFRYGGDYARSMWIIGIIIMASQVATCWIKPLPKGQIGGK